MILPDRLIYFGTVNRIRSKIQALLPGILEYIPADVAHFLNDFIAVAMDRLRLVDHYITNRQRVRIKSGCFFETHLTELFSVLVVLCYDPQILRQIVSAEVIKVKMCNEAAVDSP